MAQTGNSANHEVQGLTVVGQLAIGNPGDGDFAVLQTDGSGNLYINGVQFDPDGNFSDEVITPGGIPLYLIATSASAIATAGTIYGARCRAPKSGDIRGVYVWIGTSSGNLRGGIYTTPLTAALVWDGGSVASPGNNQWMDLGDPGAGVAPVVEGDYFDIVVVADNTTVTVGRTAGAAFAHGNVNNLHSDFAKLAASGGNTKLNWLYAAGAYAALPATITDGNRVVDNHDIAIIARIT